MHCIYCVRPESQLGLETVARYQVSIKRRKTASTLARSIPLAKKTSKRDGLIKISGGRLKTPTELVHRLPLPTAGKWVRAIHDCFHLVLLFSLVEKVAPILPLTPPFKETRFLIPMQGGKKD